MRSSGSSTNSNFGVFSARGEPEEPWGQPGSREVSPQFLPWEIPLELSAPALWGVSAPH